MGMLNSTGSTASGYFHLCKVWTSIVGGRPMSAQRYHSTSSSPRSQRRKLAGSLSGAFGHDADLNHLLNVFGKAIAIISRFTWSEASCGNRANRYRCGEYQ
jgi:hypothetical protein